MVGCCFSNLFFISKIYMLFWISSLKSSLDSLSSYLISLLRDSSYLVVCSISFMHGLFFNSSILSLFFSISSSNSFFYFMFFSNYLSIFYNFDRFFRILYKGTLTLALLLALMRLWFHWFSIGFDPYPWIFCLFLGTILRVIYPLHLGRNSCLFHYCEGKWSSFRSAS